MQNQQSQNVVETIILTHFTIGSHLPKKENYLPVSKDGYSFKHVRQEVCNVIEIAKMLISPKGLHDELYVAYQSIAGIHSFGVNDERGTLEVIKAIGAVKSALVEKQISPIVTVLFQPVGSNVIKQLISTFVGLTEINTDEPIIYSIVDDGDGVSSYYINDRNIGAVNNEMFQVVLGRAVAELVEIVKEEENAVDNVEEISDAEIVEGV